MDSRTNISPEQTRRVTSNRAPGLIPVLALMLTTGTASARADGHLEYTYFRNMLQNPSQSVLGAEARGRVTIYDGVDNDEVELAMDRQFNRIDRMMFVRIRYIGPDGSIEEDDDCD